MPPTNPWRGHDDDRMIGHEQAALWNERLTEKHSESICRSGHIPRSFDRNPSLLAIGTRSNYPHTQRLIQQLQRVGLADPLFEDPKDSATFVRKVVVCAHPDKHPGEVEKKLAEGLQQALNVVKSRVGP